MFDFEKINLVLSSNPVFFTFILIILIAYAVYVYRFTVPAISNSKKTFLVILRSLAIILLLFVFFEPILSFSKKIELKPVNLFFIDNSRSLNIKDGTKREETINNFLKNLESNDIAKSADLFSFGNNVKKINPDSLSHLNFSEGSTDFSKIFSYLKSSNRDISSLTIVSDGEITEGTNPLFLAEILNIPVYTVGIGDSTKKNDISVKSVLYNQFIYSQTPTTVLGTIINNGFGDRNVTVSLQENGKTVDQRSLTLSQGGIQSVEMNYSPVSSGEKKLTFLVSSIDGEFSKENNKKIFYVKVLSNKVKVLVIAGSPSPDLSFIKNTLSHDKNLQVNSITQTSQNKFLENNNREELLDSADVLFLIDFPTTNTPLNLLARIKNLITRQDKPYFFKVSVQTDFQRLKTLEQVLPFTFQNMVSTPYEVQPYLLASEISNPIIQNNSSNIIAEWNNLPPVLQPDALLTAKPESEIISKTVINNVPVNRPLLLSRKLGRKRSIAVLADNIWRWELQTATKNSDLFERFILNSVKWLNNKEEQKQVAIKTTKKIYSTGEKIEFTGQVYDESFNPVSDAEVNIIIKSGKENYNVSMNSLGNGLYDGFLETKQPGDYVFTGSAKINGKIIGKDSGKFNIGEVDIEFVNTRMNYDFLNSLSRTTGGKFFFPAKQNELFDILNKKAKQSASTKIETSEFNLWSNEWLMAIIILLFAIEWFFRKRFGML